MPMPDEPAVRGETTIRVRYAETDRMGLLHHANYLVYFEQARTELSTAMEMYRAMEMTFWLPETEAALAQVQEG